MSSISPCSFAKRKNNSYKNRNSLNHHFPLNLMKVLKMNVCRVIPTRLSLDSLIDLDIEQEMIESELPRQTVDKISRRERLAATRYNSVSKAETALDSVKEKLSALADESPSFDHTDLIKQIDGAILFYQNAMFHCCDDNGSSGRP